MFIDLTWRIRFETSRCSYCSFTQLVLFLSYKKDRVHPFVPSCKRICIYIKMHCYAACETVLPIFNSSAVGKRSRFASHRCIFFGSSLPDWTVASHQSRLVLCDLTGVWIVGGESSAVESVADLFTVLVIVLEVWSRIIAFICLMFFKCLQSASWPWIVYWSFADGWRREATLQVSYK